jgi:hypothetical protein
MTSLQKQVGKSPVVVFAVDQDADLLGRIKPPEQIGLSLGGFVFGHGHNY